MPRSSPDDLHGILPIDKPAGWTSHDVVGRVRGLTGMRRVGHAGTLDPFATGVLVVATGRATRLLRFIQATRKRYLAHIVLGAETDTDDVEGRLIRHHEWADWPDEATVLDSVRQFTGTIEQIPPAYSAIRVGGKRLYERARAGDEVDAPARVVEIDSIDIVRYRPPDLLIEVRCGTGTYIRSLARDIGRALGTHGYCHGLRRTAVGPFGLDRCWTLDELAGIDLRGHWRSVAEGPDGGLSNWPAVVLREADGAPWYDGRLIDHLPCALERESEVRVYTSGGTFAGLGRLLPGGRLKPEIVFRID